MRCKCLPHRASSLARDSIRCAPLLVSISACSSSIMTAPAVQSTFWPVLLVSIKYRDSGVIIRMWGGFRTICCLSRGVVSPVRTATESSSCPPIPSRGFLRFSRISAARDFRGDTYTSCSSRGSFPSMARVFSLSRNTRKADSVLPVPVGADTSTCPPAAMAGQEASCTLVGSPSFSRNHPAVPSLNNCRQSFIVYPFPAHPCPALAGSDFCPYFWN